LTSDFSPVTSGGSDCERADERPAGHTTSGYSNDNGPVQGAELDVLAGGRPEGRGPRLPAAAHRVGFGIALSALAGVVAFSAATSVFEPEPARPPAAAAEAAADATSAERADVQLRLSAVGLREAEIRDVPDDYRDAAGLAAAMRQGRTPGNFFLAVAYRRTWYGELLTGSEGVRYVPRGPVQWDPADFRRLAAPGHRNISSPLDSFLALDTALHARRHPDFSGGAFEPARLLGMSAFEARSVARIYEILDGSGVREGLPN
jgi:hypothetical protein